MGDPQNYSDNHDHPFNIIVASLETAGADILFAAGNCGPECPDTRCQGVTDGGIYGANSSPAVTCVAGVVRSKERIGYSTKGPGRLDKQKPDIACYTHFAGSGVFAADGGTSAATPVAAGVVAAIRRLYPASVLSPADLRQMLRDTAEPRGNGGGFNVEYGFGIVNVRALLDALDSLSVSRGNGFGTTPRRGAVTRVSIGKEGSMSTSTGTPSFDPHQIEKAFSAFERAFKAGGGAAASPPGGAQAAASLGATAGAPPSAAAFDPCASWKSIRGTVNGVVTALRAVGGIFPVAKRAADVIQTLATLLDQICR